MAFSVGSSNNVRLSWMFGDTPCFRFVFTIPGDAQLPQGTMVDFSIRTPNGIKVVNLTRLLEQPVGNLPYFEVFIAPTVSFGIPPGNYLLHLALKRPYGGEGNYRYTPIPAGNVTVGGAYCLYPEWLVDLDGETDSPPATEVHIDARKFIVRLPAHIHVPEPPAPKLTPIGFTVTADGSSTESTTELLIVFDKELKSDLLFSEIMLSANMAADSLMKESDSTYRLAVITETAGVGTLVIDREEISDTKRTFTVFKYEPVLPPIQFTVTANGSATVTTTELLITFDKNLESDLLLSEITLSSNVVASTLTKESGDIYRLAISVETAGDGLLTIDRDDVSDIAQAFTVFKYEPAPTPIEFTVTANGSDVESTTELLIVFDGDLENDLHLSEITLSANLTADDLVKNSDGTYCLTIATEMAGVGTLAIGRDGVSEVARTFIVFKYEPAPIEFTVAANGGVTTSTTELLIVFDGDLDSDLQLSEIILSSNITAGALVKDGTNAYRLTIIAETPGVGTLAVTRDGISANERTFAVFKYEPIPLLAQFTVTANGSDTESTTELTITFTENVASLTSDLMAAEIVLSAGLIKGELTKDSGVVYRLAVTVTAEDSGTQTIMIDRFGEVVATPFEIHVYKAAAIPAMAGYWGVLMPKTISEAMQMNSALVPVPTQDYFDLVQQHGTPGWNAFEGAKRTIIIQPVVVDSAPWMESTGLTIDDWDDYPMGRPFIITKDWGMPSAVITNGIDITYTWVPVSCTFDGVVYSGLAQPKFSDFGATSAFTIQF